MARKIGFSKVPWLGVLAGLLGYFFHATMLLRRKRDSA